MAFDGIVTKHVINELNTCLIGGKINKIYQPNKNEILFGIYANQTHYNLLVNINATDYRIHLSNLQKQNPLTPPNFCMLLRKHLIGMKIKSFHTYDLERIIRIKVEGYDELNDLITKEIVIELMGKHSNVILLNQSNHIIDSARHLDSLSGSSRDILPARLYVFPTTQKSSFLNLEDSQDFYHILLPYIGKESIDSLISSHFNGISRLCIRYLLQIHNIENTSTLEKDYHIIYQALKELVKSSNVRLYSFF